MKVIDVVAARAEPVDAAGEPARVIRLSIVLLKECR
jgi:hypothetical protein